LNDAEVSAYDRLVWPEGQVERWLVSGERRRELVAYFGEPEYTHLRALALAAAPVTADPDRVVYFVPGIMGSQLAQSRERPAPDNLLWLDPTDIQAGRLTLLTVPGEKLIAVGPVLYTWLPLKLALHAAGFTTRCFHYDWRCDLTETAAALVHELEGCAASEIHLVGHSMGGLVARAVLGTAAGRRIRTVVTLGTPHGGSFAPVQAVRGVYPLVRRLAQLDPAHTPEALSRDIFSSFHSLYQMLPRDAQPDLIDPRHWPLSGPQPNATLLARAPLFDPGGPDPRISAIAGHGYLTTINVTDVDGEFWYRYGYGGDGTVPVARATLAGCKAWYSPVAHNELPRDPAVHAAIIALLSGGTPQLAAAPPAHRDDRVTASDSDLRRQLTSKLDWNHMDSVQRRAFLDSLNSPSAQAGHL
jgi:pimeloyl-ACP methyl ester carboxylesterase